MLPRRLRVSALALAFACLGVPVVGCAQTRAPDSGGALPPEQAAYDVTFYDLAVRFVPSARRLAGRLALEADVTAPLAHLVLDLDRRLAVDSVTVAGRPAPVARRAEGDRLWITLPDTARPGDRLRAAVHYGGRPRVAPQPPWDGGVTWATTPGGQPWIGTSVQTAGADLWWPVKDHPSDEPDSMALAVTVPAPLVVATNGRRAGRTTAVDPSTGDTLRTYRARVTTPINAYAVAVHAAPYARLDTAYASTAGVRVPVSFWALPPDTATARAALPRFLDQVRFLEETLGPYPFRADKYGIAQAPFLGMEHQTIIAYGHDFTDGGLGYDAGFDALHLHELAHEWYGNALTAADWKDFWIHEGFATYVEALYAEAQRGRAGYDAVIGHFRRQVTHQQPIARRTPTTARAIYSRDLYFKGALVLHTLRHLLGDDAFRAFLRRLTYPDGPATTAGCPCRAVTTADVVAAAEAVAERRLGWFFDAYLYHAAPPRLVTVRTDDRLALRWETPAGGAAFPLPVEVAVDGAVTRLAMEGGTGAVALPTPDARVQVDPHGWLLRGARQE